MASKKRIIIKLESTAGTGYFITTHTNPTNVPEKLERRKFDPVVVEISEISDLVYHWPVDDCT